MNFLIFMNFLNFQKIDCLGILFHHLNFRNFVDFNQKLYCEMLVSLVIIGLNFCFRMNEKKILNFFPSHLNRLSLNYYYLNFYLEFQLFLFTNFIWFIYSKVAFLDFYFLFEFIFIILLFIFFNSLFGIYIL
jgi:hypothetical protein